jgi:glycosyltransferase involved in cell wall biosynthesis
LRFAPKIDAVIRSGDWDIVHCQGIHTFVAPVAMLAARRAGIPYVLTFHTGGHSSGVRNRIRSAQWSMVRPLAARAHTLIGVSEFESRLFRRQLGVSGERVITIPNGASLPRPSGPAASVSTGTAELIVSSGRLERYKGHHKVLQALPDVLRRRPQARLRIAGSGPFERDLRSMARELGVAQFVTIAPVDANDRVGMASLLASAALVTLLSDYESHGISALEAISLKRPVLVTDATALSELVEQGLAVGLAPESSTAQIADAIVDLIEHPRTPPDVSLPSWDDCAERLLDLYASIVDGVTCAS